MPTFNETSKEIVLKYADKGTYRFSRVAPDATDQQLFNLANVLNSFQADPAVQVVKVTTSMLMM